MSNLALLQGSGDTGEDSAKDSGGSRLRQAEDLAQKWQQALPASNMLPAMDAEKTSDASLLPLDRCLAREVMKGRVVIDIVMSDLNVLM